MIRIRKHILMEKPTTPDKNINLATYAAAAQALNLAT
jgi:hypothetical protein